MLVPPARAILGERHVRFKARTATGRKCANHLGLAYASHGDALGLNEPLNLGSLVVDTLRERSRKVERKKGQRYSTEFRREAVERMRGCNNIVRLARELGVCRRVLYNWRDRLDESNAPPTRTRELMLRKQIIKLKRLLANKTVELDFFRHALQRVGASRCPQVRSAKLSFARSFPLWLGWVQDWVQLKRKEWLRISGKRHQVRHLDFCHSRLLTEMLEVRILPGEPISLSSIS